jgi:hypothetical protein
MKDELITYLPYPYRFLWFTINWKKKIGFTFTNLSVFNFRENNNINNSDDYKKWIKDNGESRYMLEMIYAAAQAYCMDNRLKQKFTKSKLAAAFALADAEIQKSIVSGWSKSHTFGLVEGKKKPIAKAS